MRLETTRCIPRLLEIGGSIALVIIAVVFCYTNSFGLLQVQPKESLEEYQWGELKAIATMIADAETDEEAIGIAHTYGLCDEDGKLRLDDTKTVYFRGGLDEKQIRIIGFRHDVINDEKKAGITFCFCESFDCIPMYYTWGSSPSTIGWEQSGARHRLMECVVTQTAVPDGVDSKLARVIAEVQKKTLAYDLSSQSFVEGVCGDRLFLLSHSEVFGDGQNAREGQDETYNLAYEGEQ